MPLYGYQRRTKAALFKAWKEQAKRVLLALPTGAGKTRTVSDIAHESAARCFSVIGLAHRDELVRQMGDAFLDVFADDPGMVGFCKAGMPDGLNRPVVMASVQTAYARLPAIAERYRGERVLVIIDEAHRAAGMQYLVVLQAITSVAKSVHVIGLSATPYRLDGKPLGKHVNSDDEALFETLIEPVTFTWLANYGRCEKCGAEVPYETVCCGAAVTRTYLVRPRFYGAERPDLRKVRKRGGDYDQKELATATNTVKLVANVGDTWIKYGGGRATMGCAVDVAHAESLAADLDGRRGSWHRPLSSGQKLAEALHGGMDMATRDAILARLACGLTKVVFQCQILLEGWDSHSDFKRAKRLYGERVKYVPLEVLIDAAPTKSKGRYMQALGRITRSHPNKTDALYLGHAGNEETPDKGGHGHPDDHCGFSLDKPPDPRRMKGIIPRTGPANEGDGAITYCPLCMHPHPTGEAEECANCGAALGAGGGRRSIRVIPGELVPVDGRMRITKQRAHTAEEEFAAMLRDAAAMGFDRAWAVQNYEAKFRRKAPSIL